MTPIVEIATDAAAPGGAVALEVLTATSVHPSVAV
jgi:hypothetical protein